MFFHSLQTLLWYVWKPQTWRSFLVLQVSEVGRQKELGWHGAQGGRRLHRRRLLAGGAWTFHFPTWLVSLQVYHHLEPACNLREGHDYLLFKKGICPDWSDPLNKEGGRLIHNMKKEEAGLSSREVLATASISNGNTNPKPGSRRNNSVNSVSLAVL